MLIIISETARFKVLSRIITRIQLMSQSIESMD